jgi:hypothetical protein
MHFAIAFVVTAFFVGLAVTYVQPTVASMVPASLTSNKWVTVGTVGAVTLVSLLIAVFALRALKLPRVV